MVGMFPFLAGSGRCQSVLASEPCDAMGINTSSLCQTGVLVARQALRAAKRHSWDTKLQ